MKTPNKPNGAPEGAKTEMELAHAWLAWLDDQNDTSALGETVLRTLRSQIPDQSLGGHAEDVRQAAAELLFGRLILGNGDLLAATAEQDYAEIGRQILRSILAAGKFAWARHRQHLGREAQRRERLAQAADQGEPIIAEANALGMPLKAKADLALAGLGVAVSRGLLNKANAELVRSILKDRKSQSQIAREHGISRASVCQRLRRTALTLRRVIENEKEDM